MNKTVLLLVATLLNIHLVTLTSSKKNKISIHQQKKENKNESLDSFLKKYNNDNQKEMGQNKTNQKKENKLEKIKKQALEECTLKDIFQNSPPTISIYLKKITEFYELYMRQFDYIENCESYYNTTQKILEQLTTVKKVWGDEISIIDLAVDVQLDKIMNSGKYKSEEIIHICQLYQFCETLFRAMGEKTCNTDLKSWHKAIKKSFKDRYNNNNELTEAMRTFTKKFLELIELSYYIKKRDDIKNRNDEILKVIMFTSTALFQDTTFAELFSPPNEANNTIDDQLSTITKKKSSKLYNFKKETIKKYFTSIADIIRAFSSYTENEQQSPKQLLDLIAEAKNQKKEYSKPFITEIKRCENVINQINSYSNDEKKSVSENNTESKNSNKEQKNEDLLLQNKKKELENETLTQQNLLPYLTIHPRVSDWYTNPEKRLLEDYKDKDEEEQRWMKQIHTIPQEIAQYLLALGISCKWLKKGEDVGSTSWYIPCLFEDLKTNKSYTGFMTYGITKEKMLFHACFSRKAPNEIVSVILNKTGPSDYPSIDEKIEEGQENSVSKSGIVIKSSNTTITFTDENNEMRITICKPLCS